MGCRQWSLRTPVVFFLILDFIIAPLACAAIALVFGSTLAVAEEWSYSDGVWCESLSILLVPNDQLTLSNRLLQMFSQILQGCRQLLSKAQ